MVGSTTFPLLLSSGGLLFLAYGVTLGDWKFQDMEPGLQVQNQAGTLTGLYPLEFSPHSTSPVHCGMVLLQLL